MDYKQFSYKVQLLLADTILKKESYVAGFSKPLMSPSTFHRMYLKVQSESRLNPSNAPYVLKLRKSENREGYIKMINRKFPKFLHKAYRSATKTLGCAENTKRICDHMVAYAKANYSECPIRGNLRLIKYQINRCHLHVIHLG